MGIVDREKALEQTDLAELATEICGPPRRSGPSAKWHCPSPNHPDEHPSMGVYRNGRGQQRWKCHACGEGGTAVDLLMVSAGVDAGRALRELADRAGLSPSDSQRRSPAVPPPRPRTPAARQPSPAIEAFVARTAELLWSSTGAAARRHLDSRGFDPELIRVNRVGFDPGPSVIPRPDGLPRLGPGIVYPVLDEATGQAIYLQVRYLSPRVVAGRKYDQPTAELAPNPRLATMRHPAPTRPGLVALCEGFPDALTAAQAGSPAIAILGVAHAGGQHVGELARRVKAKYADEAFAVCFDADGPAKLPANRLADRLARTGAPVARIVPPEGCKDLNDWWTKDSDALTAQLSITRSMLPPPVLPAPTLSPPAPSV